MALGILYSGKEAKGLYNRYCVKFMKFKIGSIVDVKCSLCLYCHYDSTPLYITHRYYSMYTERDQPLRLLLNLLFYHFNRSELTFKSQCIKLLDEIAACNRLNVNALN